MPPVSGVAEQTVTLKAKAGTLEKSVVFKVVLPTLTFAPAITTIDAGTKQVFTTAINNNDSLSGIQWVLEGVGSLKAPTTGSSVEYSAPDPATVTAEQSAKLAAKLRDGVTSVLEFKVKPTQKLLTVTPDKTELIAGEGPITIKLLRTLLAADASVTFSVDPAVKGGSLGVVDANTYRYTPPAPADVTTPVTVTLSFNVDGITKTLVLTVKPKPVLVLSTPSTTLVAGSAPIVITAGRTNLDSAKVITYTITSTTPALAAGVTGNTVVGSVAPGNTATYTPPSSVTADTKVLITATTGTADADATATLELTIKKP